MSPGPVGKPDAPTGLGSVSPGPLAGPNSQSLTFDANNNPVLAYVQQPGSSAGTLVVARKIASGWTNVAGGAALAQFGVCVAAAPDGSVGFAYVNAAGSLCFNSDGDTLGSMQVVSSAASSLTPCSLAYDSAGNPAIVYSVASSGPTAPQLCLARRNSQGVWTGELLPISSQQASLAFDALGEPLIAASTSGGINLLGIDLTVHWNGAGSDNNWSTTGNWSGGVPANGTPLKFGAATGANVVSNNNLGGKTFSNICFANNAAAYVVDGNAITISGSIVNQGNNSQTLNLPITLVAGAGLG